MLAEVNSQIMLVVSEDPEVRTYLEMALRCEGFAVEVTEDDEEALRFLQSGGPICAVLLDMSLVKRDGLQVLRDIRALERHLPVIAMSGNPSSGAVVEIMRAGANDFLTKPVSPDG